MRTKRIRTSTIRFETRYANAYYDPDINPRAYYGSLEIRYGPDFQIGAYVFTSFLEWFPRWNFTTMQAEASRS